MDFKFILGTAVIFVVGNTRTVNADCAAITSGPYVVRRFGNDCDFMCHCENNIQCDYVTGNCLNGCEAGWYGPACQYRNAINGCWCSQIDSTNYCTQALDGNVSTCSMTNNATSDRKQPPWWRAWLPSAEYITELSITTNQESLHYFNEFQVFTENVTLDERNQSHVSSDNRILCYKQGTDAPSGISFTVICDSPAVGNQVRIQLSSLAAQLVLCDVKINGGRNMAFQRNITYSSLETKDYPAENSVDGIGYHEGWESCFGTNWTAARIDQWWTIHFGYDVVLHRLTISSVNNDRIRNYQVISYNDESSPLKIYDDIGNYPPTREVALGRVRLSKLTLKRVNVLRLILCEVELYGDCPEHTCGLKCDKVCHCATEPLADKISGRCSMGCEDGWRGMENKCDTVCTPGTFGMNCSETCGHCKEGTTCHYVNGTCLDGCLPGYTGSTCKEECFYGTFGLNCSQSCSGNCYKAFVCHVVNGSCPDGCAPGYTYDRCDEECPPGTFGKTCSESCGHCKGGTSCHPVNGTCPDGCQPGYMDSTCRRACTSGVFGMNCSEKCGHCKEGTTCLPVNGTCSGGCHSGYIGSTCTEICTAGAFGLNCSELCGHCIEGTTCHFEHGTCLYGCQSGYKGSRCRESAGLVSDAIHATESTSVTAIVLGVFLAISVIVISVLSGIICQQRCSKRVTKKYDATVHLNDLYEDKQSEEQPADTYSTPRDICDSAEHVYDKI